MVGILQLPIRYPITISYRHGCISYPGKISRIRIIPDELNLSKQILRTRKRYIRLLYTLIHRTWITPTMSWIQTETMHYRT